MKEDKQDIQLNKVEEQVEAAPMQNKAIIDDYYPQQISQLSILERNGIIYSEKLKKEDTNGAKFYNLQIVHNHSKDIFNIWNRWGRIGAPGQNCLKLFKDADSAITDWNNKKNQKIAQGYIIQPQNSNTIQSTKKQQQAHPQNKSTTQLLKNIFDKKILQINIAMLGYDNKKLLLSKLSENTVVQAYKCLKMILQQLDKEQKIKQYTCNFYSLIPHDFGFLNWTKLLLDNVDKIKQKSFMLQKLQKIQYCLSVSATCSAEQALQKLKLSLNPLDAQSEKYQQLNQYFVNCSSGNAHIQNIFEVVTFDEKSNKMSNNTSLFWYGCNFYELLYNIKNGLSTSKHIPKELLEYGHGVYLSDSVDLQILKAKNHYSNKRLLLLVQCPKPDKIIQSSEPKTEISDSGITLYMKHNKFKKQEKESEYSICVVKQMELTKIRYIVQFENNP